MIVRKQYALAIETHCLSKQCSGLDDDPCLGARTKGLVAKERARSINVNCYQALVGHPGKSGDEPFKQCVIVTGYSRALDPLSHPDLEHATRHRQRHRKISVVAEDMAEHVRRCSGHSADRTKRVQQDSSLAFRTVSENGI